MGKYIFSIVLGFAVIVGVGVLGIKVFHAKRIVAPEVPVPTSGGQVNIPSQPLYIGQQTATAVVDDDGHEIGVATPLVIPTETSADVISLDQLPKDIQNIFSSTTEPLQIFRVAYANGKQGFRVEQKQAVVLDKLYREFPRQHLSEWKGVGQTALAFKRAVIEREGFGFFLHITLNEVSNTETALVFIFIEN